jgi:hypothetical protein
LKQEAARRGQTMSEIVEAALRLFFRNPRQPRQPPELPTFDLGAELVDLADREALYRVMEED